jgi:hypothetical protein
MNWFDYRESRLYKWVLANTFSLTAGQDTHSLESEFPEVWKERSDAENSVKTYLSDLPSKKLSSSIT